MKGFFPLLLLAAFSIAAQAQTAPATQPYGKIDQADLELKTCDFEKDANAEVLFAKGNFYYSDNMESVILEIHRRIKIFNENGNGQADIKLEYYARDRKENITGLEAETINLVNGKTEITKLDKKSFFNKEIDKNYSEIAFTFPNVKPGCIIEFRYRLNKRGLGIIPTWNFQDKIPVRYSEYATSIPEMFYFRPDLRVFQPMAKNTSVTNPKVLKIMSHAYAVNASSQETETIPYNALDEVRAVANVHSLSPEPFMASFEDNVQHIAFNIVSNKPLGGFNVQLMDTWAKVGGFLIDDEDFGGQLKRSLSKEQEIINGTYGLKTTDDKIAYVFNQVKNNMKWNGGDRWYTIDGTSRAWDNKSGNSTEINLILYHLLKQCGVNAYPMVVSTPDYGRVNPFNTSPSAFNRTVVYVQGDNNNKYVLDATGKYNQYNETPAELLNSLGLWIDRSKNGFDTVYIRNDQAVQAIGIDQCSDKTGR